MRNELRRSFLWISELAEVFRIHHRDRKAAPARLTDLDAVSKRGTRYEVIGQGDFPRGVDGAWLLPQ